MYIRVLILAALVRLLLATEKPFLCSTLYVLPRALFELAAGASMEALALSCGLAWGLASLYFWLLNRFDSGTGLWWTIAIVGLAIGLV